VRGLIERDGSKFVITRAGREVLAALIERREGADG
jgi:hypothetical protein